MELGTIIIDNAIEIIGWIANIAYAIGSLSLSRRSPVVAQCFNLIGGALYTAVGILSGIYSLWILSIFLTLVNAYGIWNWKRIKGHTRAGDSTKMKSSQRVAAALIEMEGMKITNEIDKINNAHPTYDEFSFYELLDKYDLKNNDKS